MTKKSVLFRKDESCEMLEVYVDGKLYDSGNYWDFDFVRGVPKLLDELGIQNSEEDYYYEDEEDE